MLFIKAFTSYFHIYRPPPTFGGCLTHIIRHHPSDCANGAIHHHHEKPPKSGLIC